jgi:hypothetical protein
MEQQEKLFAYYQTPMMTADCWQKFVEFFFGELEIIQVAVHNDGAIVEAMVAISQEGLAKGRAEWEKTRCPA